VRVDKFLTTLKPKEAAFIVKWLESGNGTEAAMNVYKCKNRNVAGVIANKILRKVKNPTLLYLESQGLSFGKVVKVVKDATRAEKVITSHTEPDYKVPDHPTRLKAAEIAAKWLGIEQQTPTQATQININLPDWAK